MNAADRPLLAELLSRPALRRLIAALDGDGEETRIVGGAVRNALLGRPVADVDLATTATPDTVAARAKAAGFKPVPTGIAHGTVTVVADGAPYEVTTLREDVETHGRRATVRFGRDFRADAQRRDFTINALSVGADGTVHDYVGGLADLEAHRVVFIGEPAARIREDYLRILRFFRFHAAYGEGPLDPAGFSAALAERSGLAMLSRERVRAELLKLLAARRAVEVVQALADSGFAQRFLGGVVEIGRFARAVGFEHEEGGHPDPVHRLAALAVMVAEDADRLRDLLRLSGAEHARLAAYAAVLARMKSRAEPLDAAAVRRFVAEAGIATVRDVLTATEGEPRPRLTGDGLQAYRRFAAGEEAAPQFPLKGADLVRRGIAKGPEVGRRLERAREAWLAEGCLLDPAATARLLDVALAP
ncbi:MAG: CCA tRNA nucleotidyltransferase [Microvirga sp.]|nr:CCA tRNA nucleotidyltransferase [Beijerinckiaceae bacterium]